MNLPTLLIELLVLLVTIDNALGAEGEISSTDVTFRSVDAELSGTLVTPAHPVAAVVWVHGSGKSLRINRRERELAREGIAMLSYDKRGVGKSTGTYVGPEVGTNNVTPENLKQLANDAASAVAELRRRLDDKRVPIGLFGGSQAGWVIPLAAEISPSVEFIVLWSGALVTTREQLRFQNFTQQQSDFWDRHTDIEVRERIANSEFDTIKFEDTDPYSALRKLSIPGFWVYGGKDLNVPARISIARIESMIAQGKHYEYKYFPTLGHQLGDEVLPDVIAWIKKRATK